MLLGKKECLKGKKTPPNNKIAKSTAIKKVEPAQMSKNKGSELMSYSLFHVLKN